MTQLCYRVLTSKLWQIRSKLHNGKKSFLVIQHMSSYTLRAHITLSLPEELPPVTLISAF